MSTIFEDVLKSGIEYDSHCSDLYIPVNETTKKILADHPEIRPVTTFINRLNGQLWYDVPFAYKPYYTQSIVRG